MEYCDLGDLFKKNYKQYVKYAATFVGNDDAEDMLQRLFIRLFRNNYDMEMVSGTIFLIIKRECYSYNDHIARKKRKIKTCGSYRILSSLSDDTVTNTVLDNEFYEHAMHLFGIFSKKRRECLKLFYLDGFSSPEIAKILGCSPCTVRDHIFHARIVLRGMKEEF